MKVPRNYQKQQNEKTTWNEGLSKNPGFLKTTFDVNTAARSLVKTSFLTLLCKIKQQKLGSSWTPMAWVIIKQFKSLSVSPAQSVSKVGNISCLWETLQDRLGNNQREQELNNSVKQINEENAIIIRILVIKDNTQD